MRWRRFFTGVGVTGLVGIGVVGLLAAGFVGFLRTRAGNLWLELQIEQAVTGSMQQGSFVIGTVETDLFGNLRVQDLEIRDGSGRPLVRLRDAHAHYRLLSLLTGPLRVTELRGIGLEVVLDRGKERMLLAELFGPPSGSDAAFQLPIDLDVSDLLVEGIDLQIDDSFVLTGGVVSGGLISEGPVFIGSGVQACAHLVQPGPLPLCVEGPFTWDGTTAVLPGLVLEAPGSAIAVDGLVSAENVALTLAVGTLDLEGIDGVASYVGLDGTWAGTLRVTGPVRALTIEGDLSGTGENTGRVVLEEGYWNTGETTEWGGDLHAVGFDVEQAYKATGRPVVLDGDLRLEAVGLRFPDDLVIDLTYAGNALVEDRWSIEEGAFEGRIEGGVLTLGKGDFHGIAGPLGATGTVDLREGPLDLRITGSLDAEELTKLGIVGLSGRNDVDLTLRGDLKTGDARFAVAGRLDFHPLLYQDLRFERMVAVVRGSVQGADYDFTVDAEGTGGDAYGLKIQSLSALDLDVRSVGGDLRVRGPVTTGPLRYPGLGTFESASSQVDVRLPGQGERAVIADVALGPYDLQSFPGNEGALRLSLRGDRLQYDVRLDAWGRDLLVSSGTYDLGSAALVANRLELAPTPRLAWTAEGPVSLRVVDGGVAETALHLKGLHGDISVTGQLANQGPVDGAIDIRNLQLDALAELFPDRFGGLSGVLDLHTTLTGPADAVELDSQVKLLGLWVEDATRWLDVEGTLRGGDGVVQADLVVGSAGEPLAKITGGLPVVLDLGAPGLNADGQVDAQIVLLPGPLERLEYVTVSELGLPEGSISAVLNLDGALADPDLSVRGVLEQPLGGWQEPGRTEFTLHRQGLAFDGSAVLRQGLAERATLNAVGLTELGRFTSWMVRGGEAPDTSDLELWIHDMAVGLSLSRVPAESLLALSDSNLPATGAISGGLQATGSPYTPELTGDLHWLQGSFAGYDLDAGSARIRPDEKGLGVDVQLAFADGGRGLLWGTLPVHVDLREERSGWADGPLDLEIDAEGMPLGMLTVVDSGLSETSGAIDLAGTIGGTIAAPNGDLVGKVREGSFVYRDLGLRVEALNGDIEGRRRRIKLKNVVAETEPLYPIGLFDESRRSEVRLAGSANLDGLSIAELTAKIELHDAWVSGTSTAGLRMDGEVVVSGTWPGLKIQGDVGLVNGRITYDPDTYAASGSLRSDRRLVIHRPGTPPLQLRPEPSTFEHFELDLDVDLNRNLEVIATYPFFDDFGSLTANLTRATLTGRLGGDLNIALDDAGNTVLGGEVDVVKGDVQLLRTEFNLDQGKVYFLGGEVGETQLEINGSSSVQGQEVRLRVRGTASQPVITTTAEGYDQSQVLVMLLTNRAPESLATNQGLQASNEAAQLGQTAALLLASSVLTGTASGALSIDADGSVKVGVPWSSAVFAQLVLNAFADRGENILSLSLDWTLAPHVLLEIGAGERFQWSDLTWETRF